MPPLAPATSLRVRLAIFLLWLIVFAPVLNGRDTFVRGDAGRYTAFADFSRERFAATGERTFWNPYVFLGLPTVGSLADPRPQWLPSPLLSASDALTRTEGGTPLWPPLVACLAGALGAAWLARRLWASSPPAMALAGGLWLLAPGLLIPLAFGHDAQTITAALIPVTLLAAEAVLAAGSTRGALAAALGLALSLAAQVLGGHPQYVVFTGIALVPFAILRARSHARVSRLAFLGAAAALAMAMSAGLWLPALHFSAHAQRADPGFAAREAFLFTLSPRDLLSLAWPHAVGYGDAAYWGGMRGTDYSHALGLVALPLAVVGAFARTAARSTARVFAALALLGVLLALGRNVPILGVLVQALPIVGTFRTPVSWMTLPVLAGALLAARGLDRVVEGGRAQTLFRATLAAAIAALALFFMRGPIAEAWLDAARGAELARAQAGLVREAAIERFANAAPAAANSAATDLALQFLLAAVALGALVLAHRRADPRLRSGAAMLVALLACASPLALVVGPLRAATGARASLRAQAPPPLAQAAAQDPQHRAGWFEREWALSQRWSLSDDWAAWRARQVLGLSGAIPARWDQAARAGLYGYRSFLRACAIRHVAFPGPDGADTVGVWADALPRAYAVAEVRAVPDDASAIAAMQDAAWDPARTALAIASTDRTFARPDAVRIRWERDDPDRLELVVSAPSPAYVVVADADFPGWSTRLDGRKTPAENADLLFRGIAVPAGEHRIAMAYVPEGWAVGRTLAIAGWLAALLGAVAIIVAGRARRTRTHDIDTDPPPHEGSPA